MLKPGKNVSMDTENVFLSYYTIIQPIRARNTSGWILCIIQEITILLTKTFCFCHIVLSGSDKHFLSSVHERGHETANFKYYFYLLQKVISAGQKLLANTFKLFYQFLFFLFCDKLHCLGLSALNNDEQKLHNIILILSFPAFFLSPEDASPAVNLQWPWKQPSNVKDSPVAAFHYTTSRFWTATGAEPNFQRKWFLASIFKR